MTQFFFLNWVGWTNYKKLLFSKTNIWIRSSTFICKWKGLNCSNLINEMKVIKRDFEGLKGFEFSSFKNKGTALLQRYSCSVTWPNFDHVTLKIWIKKIESFFQLCFSFLKLKMILTANRSFTTLGTTGETGLKQPFFAPNLL